MSDSLFDRFSMAANHDDRQDWLDVERRARRFSRRRSRRTAFAALAAALALTAVAPAAGVDLGALDTLGERLTTLVDGGGQDTVPREMSLEYDPITRVMEVRGAMSNDAVAAVRLSFQDGSPPLFTQGSHYDFRFEGERMKQPAVLEGLDAQGARVTATEIPPLVAHGTDLFIGEHGEHGYLKIRNVADIRPGPFKFMEPFVPGAQYCVSYSSDENWNELRRC